MLTSSLTPLQLYSTTLASLLPCWIYYVEVKSNEIVLVTSRRDLRRVLFFLKTHSAARFEQLVELTAVDYPLRHNRFQVVYFLLSVQYNVRLRVVVHAAPLSSIPSLCFHFASAGWLEREVWDMYGLFFADNSDLRRLLTDYGFAGHPLRKDFPLSGFVEVFYNRSTRRLSAVRVELTQEFRSFRFPSPWVAKH